MELNLCFVLERERVFPIVGNGYPELLYTVGLKVGNGSGIRNHDGNWAGSQSLFVYYTVPECAQGLTKSACMVLA
jgi:hypothetical protein